MKFVGDAVVTDNHFTYVVALHTRHHTPRSGKLPKTINGAGDARYLRLRR